MPIGSYQSETDGRFASMLLRMAFGPSITAERLARAGSLWLYNYRKHLGQMITVKCLQVDPSVRVSDCWPFMAIHMPHAIEAKDHFKLVSEICERWPLAFIRMPKAIGTK